MLRVFKETVTIRFLLLLIIVLFLFSTNVKAASDKEIIFIAVNDEFVQFTDVMPYSLDGVTYLPLRTMADLLVATIVYDKTDNTTSIVKDNQSMKIDLHDHTYSMDTTTKKPLAIKMNEGRMMVPLRFIADHFHLKVTYFEKGPIARLINQEETLQYSDEQLYFINKEEIERVTKQWAAKYSKKDLDKVAYLTFDDGPNDNTSKILDILQSYGASATFFMVEPKINSYKDDVKRIVAEKHTVGSHSVTHQKDKVYQSPKALLDEMNKTSETIKKVTGVDSNLIRPPYGSKPYLTKEFRDVLAYENIKVWDWNVDSLDWKNSAEETIVTVKRQVTALEQGKRQPVILFHNGLSTVEALPDILEFLLSKGYVLKAYDPEQHFMVNFWNDERL